MDALGPDLFTRSEMDCFSAYWRSLPKTGLVPERSAFRPDALPHLLPYLIILECRAPDDIRYRLIGSHHERYNPIRAGLSVTVMAAESGSAREMQQRIWNLVTRPCGAHVHFTMEHTIGVSQMESLSFPLYGPAGEKFSIGLVLQRKRTASFKEPLGWRVGGGASFRYIDIGAGLPAGSQP